jgi:hypothetical protein
MMERRECMVEEEGEYNMKQKFFKITKFSPIFLNMLRKIVLTKVRGLAFGQALINPNTYIQNNKHYFKVYKFFSENIFLNNVGLLPISIKNKNLADISTHEFENEKFSLLALGPGPVLSEYLLPHPDNHFLYEFPKGVVLEELNENEAVEVTLFLKKNYPTTHIKFQTRIRPTFGGLYSFDEIPSQNAQSELPTIDDTQFKELFVEKLYCPKHPDYLAGVSHNNIRIIPKQAKKYFFTFETLYYNPNLVYSARLKYIATKINEILRLNIK